MSSYVLSLLLAVIACVIGGTLGGMILARPATLLEAAGLSNDDTPKPSLLAEGRALGGVLIAAHGVAALYLGYQPRIGAAMALALALAWLGAAVGRAVSAVLDGEAGRYNRGAMLFNALIGVTLTLPWFQIGKVVLRGPLGLA
ncbi:DUF4345 domain-containing protein [Caulobacter vibrioides]|uniref:DUF4345 domain-containing protein n=1 Tax=Caulobacter vibrioides TaxID=155892 RepID=A0A290MLJ3_CAUVI|nr:DUF4345 family protein [Caulobacter vibrioides]ATC32936.1 DUF4345 domain-containing protein [Caulobacter vibrioides]